MKRERDGDDKAGDVDAADNAENFDVTLADINHLMQKCRDFQQLVPNGSLDDDEEEEEESMEEPQSADDLLANIEELMSKCEVVQKNARDIWEENLKSNQEEKSVDDPKEPMDD